MSLSHRIDKVASRSEIAEGALGVRTLAVGGVGTGNKPLALLEAVLAGLDAPVAYFALSSSSIDVDMALALGSVAETYIPVALYNGVRTWPNLRHASESGEATAHVVDVATLMAGYFASAEGVPFHPVAAIAGSDVSKVNPLLEYLEDERFGKVAVVRPIQADLAIVHALRADRFGNCLIAGASGPSEAILVRAARRVVVSCEELVEPGEIRYDDPGTVIPGMYVDQVYHVPNGAWPGGSPGRYNADHEYLREYWEEAEAGRVAQDAERRIAPARRLRETYRAMGGRGR